MVFDGKVEVVQSNTWAAYTMASHWLCLWVSVQRKGYL